MRGLLADSVSRVEGFLGSQQQSRFPVSTAGSFGGSSCDPEPFSDLSSASRLSVTHQVQKAIFGCEGSAHHASS